VRRPSAGLAASAWGHLGLQKPLHVLRVGRSSAPRVIACEIRRSGGLARSGGGRPPRPPRSLIVIGHATAGPRHGPAHRF
jgi:hypothetical protein